MSTTSPDLPLLDFEPKLESFRDHVLEGLARPQKELSSKFLYDERGSVLFDKICDTEDYYSTRTELSIMRRYGEEMADAVGPRALLVEYGSGASTKILLLLQVLRDIAAYVPLDISREFLLDAAREVAVEHPDLEVLPVCADFTAEFDLPKPAKPASRRVVYFPGSTIGNFRPEQVPGVLQRIARVCRKGGGLLIGVDLRKSPEVLRRAYNDSEGVTAEFNLNLLDRMNRELGADFDRNNFEHRSIWRDEESRIEMHLISRTQQSVTIEDRTFDFEEGESIRTEYSCKFTLDGFEALAADAGLVRKNVWTDDRNYFSVQYFEVE